ncbi:MAG: hypothetical protein LIP01_05505 [Tannerellaceae bacterium]|nr:hypothetical protein [Tannerellaceae bacterium]
MKFRKHSFGGRRPVYTAQPVTVTGGFNLDEDKVEVLPGMMVFAGTLAHADEITRKMVFLKTGRVRFIDTDPKVITLESDEFICPLFLKGGRVVKVVSGQYEDAPIIEKIEDKEDSYIITLSDEIAGLAVGDVIQHVIEGDSGKAVRVAKSFPAVVISDHIVGHDEKDISVSIDSGHGAFFERRIPPIPAELKKEKFLTDNPNIKLTQSY